MPPVAQIYHNPRCSKSRQALSLLESQGITTEIILYQKNPPSLKTLANLQKALGLGDLREMMRTQDGLYRELGLADPGISQDSLLHSLAEHPELLERPIVVIGKRARIGRPPEAILDLINN